MMSLSPPPSPPRSAADPPELPSYLVTFRDTSTTTAVVANLAGLVDSWGGDDDPTCVMGKRLCVYRWPDDPSPMMLKLGRQCGQKTAANVTRWGVLWPCADIARRSVTIRRKACKSTNKSKFFDALKTLIPPQHRVRLVRHPTTPHTPAVFAVVLSGAPEPYAACEVRLRARTLDPGPPPRPTV